MATVNDDVILAVLARCDIPTVVECRAVSKGFKCIIDEELTLANADFSTLTFRQRRNITDSVITRDFAHIFRRASIIYLDGTEISHYGAMKLVTDYTKELHVERCPRVDLGKLIQAIAGDRWLSYDLDPVHLYTKTGRGARGTHDYSTILKPLYEYNWAVIMMSNDCRCRYVKIEEYQGTNAVLCHACDKDVKRITMDCYGCEANVCGECQPLNLRCSVEEYRQYCAQCAGAMVDRHDHWCCDTGEFKMEPTR
ncbi:hypothetical protein EDD11_005024 [Mortierella claussenii]|nr:hypothetical protein EDD11_005024 [Mortierella claussenii]